MSTELEEYSLSEISMEASFCGLKWRKGLMPPLWQGGRQNSSSKKVYFVVFHLIILYSQSRSKGSRILDSIILWKIVFWSGNFRWNFICHRRTSASVSNHILMLSSTSSDLKHQALLWETFIP